MVAFYWGWQNFVIANSMSTNTPGWITPLAKAGLTAKGIVYCLVGIIAFMAAFHIGGQSTSGADTTGALRSIEDLPAGKWLLLAVGVGLLCYAVWRVVEAFTHKQQGEKDVKKWGKKARYLLSGLGYLSIGFAAMRIALQSSGGNGSGGSNQTIAAELLSKPMGQWLLGGFALIIAAVGIYQVYYALSEKYKKHVSSMNYSSGASSALIKTGKAGYVARGIVWLIIGWMLLKAAMQAQAAEAGDTAQAFGFLQDSSYGKYLLGLIALGVVCYGIFCFVRAQYEKFT